MSKKLFITEDDANILSTLQAKFSVDGFQVETNAGTDEAREILKKVKIFKPDFIILDLLLPKTDGFEILKKIKGDNEISKTPVFIFTNLSDADSRARSEALGANYYFIKDDFMVDEFVEKVEKIVGRIICNS
jgi:DNA-binding response OmpR family regulator